MRLTPLLLGGVLILAAGCDRLPARGGEGQECFGNETCSGDLICDQVSYRCCPPEGCGCTPDCSNKCNVGDGCGGVCGDECWSGYVCKNDHCDDCTTPDACGPECEDCTAGDTNWGCVSDGASDYRCGCTDGLAECASGVCLVSELCECTPDCTDKVCGESDGCDGVCQGDCGAGEFCDFAHCASCLVDEACGSGCVDCSLQSTDRACVSLGGTGVVDHLCGCSSDADCADGESCDGASSHCLPGEFCSDSTNCGQDGDCTITGNGLGMVCVDRGEGDCACGCLVDGDCEIPGVERCLNQACCTSQCAGSCGGEADGGCPGLSCDSCPEGQGCLGGTCQLCDSAETCGPLCQSCNGDPAGGNCVSDGVEFHCGCADNGDCVDGWCDQGFCSPALVTGWSLNPTDTTIRAMAITPPGADPSVPYVAVGGDDGGGSHLIRLWALDGFVSDTPDVILGAGAQAHHQPVFDLAFAADGDLFSSDEGGTWLQWVNQTDGWDLAPINWQTETSSAGFFLSAGRQDENVIVGATRGQPGLDVTFYGAAFDVIHTVSRNGNVLDFAIKESGDLAVVCGFYMDPDPGGAVAVNLGDNSEHTLAEGKDAYKVALSTHGSASFDAALVVDVDGTEQLVFYDDVLGTPSEQGNRYTLDASAAQLVLVLEDGWALTSAEGGKIYAYRTGSSEEAGPYQVYDANDCPDAPLLAAGDDLLVTACVGGIRLWDVDALLRAMGVAAP